MAWTRTEETRAIGRRVRAERIQAGLSRTELGHIVGTSPDMITQYEMGYKMSDLRLSKIAKVLGRSFDYMRTGEGMPYATEMLQPGSLAPEITAPIATVILAALEPSIRRMIREEIDTALRHSGRPSLGRTPPRGAAPRDGGASRRSRSGGRG